MRIGFGARVQTIAKVYRAISGGASSAIYKFFDKYYDNVTLHLPLIGATVEDSSNSANTITVSGGAQITETQSKFSTASLYLDGVDSYLSTPYSTTDFDWFAEDFTVECWIRPTDYASWGALTAGQPNVICNSDPSGSTYYWMFGALKNGALCFYYYNGTGAAAIQSASGLIPEDEWSHISFTKSFDRVDIFVNGSRKATASISGTPTSSATYDLNIGVNNGTYFKGYINDIQITKGVCRNRLDFTPLQSTLETSKETLVDLLDSSDPYWDNVVLRCTFDGENDSRYFTDYSNFNQLMYLTYDTTEYLDNTYYALIDTSSYKYGTSSLHMYREYPTITHNPSLDFNDEDFTIEFWYSATSNSSFYIGKEDASNGWHLTVTTSGNLEFGQRLAGVSTTVLTAAVSGLTGFNHFAFVRNNNVITVYVNGVSQGSAAITANLNSDSNFYLGTYYNIKSLANANIDDLRITKGTARYTTNFTAPTAALPAPSEALKHKVDVTDRYVKLNPNNYSTPTGDEFGGSCAINDTYYAVSAAQEDSAAGSSIGVIYVFSVEDNSLVYTLENPNVGGGNVNDFFAREYNGLAISGNYLIASAYFDQLSGTTVSYSGSVYVYDLTTGTLAYSLVNPDISTANHADYFGFSFGAAGNYLAIGAYQEDTDGLNDSGIIYVYALDTGTPLYNIKNPLGAGGAYTNFGFSVACGENYILAGQYNVNKAYVFDITDGSLVHTLTNPSLGESPSTADNFSYYSGHIDDTYTVISASSEDPLAQSNGGVLYVFDTPTGSLLYTIPNPNIYRATLTFDYFGRYTGIKVSGDYCLAVATSEDQSTATTTAVVYMFDLKSGQLVYSFQDNYEDSPGGDYYGGSIGISGTKVLVTARGEDAPSDGSGVAYVYTYSSNVNT